MVATSYLADAYRLNKRYASIIFLVAIGLLISFFSQQAQAAGKVKLLLGVAGEVGYSNNQEGQFNSGGIGIVLDFKGAKKRSSFALDLYSQTGDKNVHNFEEGFSPTTQDAIGVVMLGGRWNARKHGFYIGGGIMFGDGITVTNHPRDGRDRSSGITLGHGITMGYDHKFANGLTLGGHLVRSIHLGTLFNLFESLRSPSGKNYEIPPNNGGFILQQLSFGIGYAW